MPELPLERQPGVPLRVVVFRDRPDTILIHVPEGATLILPRLSPPFNRVGVAAALRSAGLVPRVIEAPRAGRWTASVQAAVNAERAERRQQHTMVEAAAMKPLTANPHEGERASLVLRKQLVDKHIGELKTKIGAAKSRAFTDGRYMQPNQYRALESQLEDLRAESQSIQARLTEIRRENHMRSRPENKERCERFVSLASKRLPQDLFDEIMSAVLDEEPTLGAQEE